MAKGIMRVSRQVLPALLDLPKDFQITEIALSEDERTFNFTIEGVDIPEVVNGADLPDLVAELRQETVISPNGFYLREQPYMSNLKAKGKFDGEEKTEVTLFQRVR